MVIDFVEVIGGVVVLNLLFDVLLFLGGLIMGVVLMILFVV